MKVTGIKCLDTSAWLTYYFGENTFVKEIIESDDFLITSVLSLFEIKKKLLSIQKEPIEFLNFIKQRSEIIFLDITLVEKGAEISFEKKLGAIDSLIYATAINKRAELITGDNDFRGLDGATII